MELLKTDTLRFCNDLYLDNQLAFVFAMEIFMTAKIVTFLMILTAAAIGQAYPTGYSKLAAAMYPNSLEDQNFTQKFFELVEAHKTTDPLIEGKGPSIKEFSLDKVKFAFITNVSESKADLIFFNWNKAVFSGLEFDQSLTNHYGSNVYILKNVNKKSIASQGRDRSQLTNFSYMIGANTFEKRIKKTAPLEFQIPDEMLNWKPNPDYLDRSSALRQALDIESLVMFSPRKKDFYDGNEITETTIPFMEAHFLKYGGFQNMIMGMMVHETFHVKEGEDQVRDLVAIRNVHEDRSEIIRQIQQNPSLRGRMILYQKIVFSIGENLKNKNLTQAELDHLSDLKTVVIDLKTNFPEVWKFIWNYEYTEGFAEYVSAYSMIQVGIASLAQKIDLEKTDPANNLAYRTGALGGLYLVNRLKQMPFSNDEDHQESVWEIILRLKGVVAGKQSTDQLIAIYEGSAGIDSENEIKRITDYLISTSEN